MISVNIFARPIDVVNVQQMFTNNIQQSLNFLLLFSFIDIKMRLQINMNENAHRYMVKGKKDKKKERNEERDKKRDRKR